MLLECADVLITVAVVLIAASFIAAFGHNRRVEGGPAMPKPEEKYILGYGMRWSVTYPLGHDPVTRRPLYHRKSIHGPKKDALAYRDWYADLMLAVRPRRPLQSELQNCTLTGWSATSSAKAARQSRGQRFSRDCSVSAL